MTKFKIGDWVEVDGNRFFVFREDAMVSKDGWTRRFPGKALTHLPNCTGWDWTDWRDEVDIGEGWRRLRPDEKVEEGDEYMWCSHQPWEKSIRWKHGSDRSTQREDTIYRRRVEPPKPKYRPFASMHEFKPHRDRWIRAKKTGVIGTIGSYGENGVYATDSYAFCSWEKFVLEYVFDDGGEPCGVLNGNIG